jgi:hypothetical protein
VKALQEVTLKPLELLKLKHRNRGGGFVKEELWAGHFRAMYKATAQMVLRVCEGWANTYSLEQIEAVQKELKPVWTRFEFVNLPPAEVLKLCEQLRVIWEHSTTSGRKNSRKQVEEILDEWWHHYDLSDSERWTVDYKTKSFFPREGNLRGLMASALFDNLKHLKKCVKCAKYYIGKRRDSSWCMEADCQRDYNNKRQQRKEERDRLKKERKQK